MTNMDFWGLTPMYWPFIDRLLIFPKFLNLVFCLIIKNIMYSMPYLFSKTSNIRILELKIFKLQQFQHFVMIFN